MESQSSLPQLRGARADTDRRTFLASLLNEDLSNLTKWHEGRPHHEQKRFLRSVDALYKAFDNAVGDRPKPKPSLAERQATAVARQASAAAATAAAARAAAKAAEEDPLNGPPRTPRAFETLEAAVLPTQPIEVFEQKKRRGLREEENSLNTWMEGGSITSQTTASTGMSHQTRFSQLTATSASATSICSDPGTMHQSHYRYHKRAFAINRNTWSAGNQHSAGALKYGIPNYGFPDSERMQTSFKQQFGSRDLSQNINDKMYENVLNSSQHQFVQKFLETAPPDQREQFTGMVRSLQSLRKLPGKRSATTTKDAYDLHEHTRLWKPPVQQPVFDTSQLNVSRVPLGGLAEKPKPSPPRALPRAAAIEAHPPPSPSVSNLGSLPLTRLSTPMTVAGYETWSIPEEI